MTEYELKVPGALLSSLMSEQDGLARLVADVLNQVLDGQAVEQLGALRYERSENARDTVTVTAAGSFTRVLGR